MIHGMNTLAPTPAASYHADVRAIEANFTVQATFSRTWHLRSRDGWILSVTSAPYDGPLTIRLVRHTLEDLPVFHGMSASLRDGKLVVGVVQVILDDATAWSPQPIAHAGPFSPDALQHDLTTIAHRVAGSRAGNERVCAALSLAGSSLPAAYLAPPSVGGPAVEAYATQSLQGGASSDAITRRTITAIAGLATALTESRRSDLQTHALALLGLGPGLTPAGDDVLCGLLAGLHVLGARGPLPRDGLCISLTGALERAAMFRTTALSRTLIHYAGRGVVVEPLLDVLWSLGSGTPIAGLDALLGIGHSSGSDMLAGALLAAASLARRGNSGARALTCPA